MGYVDRSGVVYTGGAIRTISASRSEDKTVRLCDVASMAITRSHQELLPRDKKYLSALTALSISTATELCHTSGFQSRLIAIHTACQTKHKHGCYKMDDRVLSLSPPTSALDGLPVCGGTYRYLRLWLRPSHVAVIRTRSILSEVAR
jgi:hypothetical protein